MEQRHSNHQFPNVLAKGAASFEILLAALDALENLGIHGRLVDSAVEELPFPNARVREDIPRLVSLHEHYAVSAHYSSFYRPESVADLFVAPKTRIGKQHANARVDFKEALKHATLGPNDLILRWTAPKKSRP